MFDAQNACETATSTLISFNKNLFVIYCEITNLCVSDLWLIHILAVLHGVISHYRVTVTMVWLAIVVRSKVAHLTHMPHPVLANH